MDDRLEDLLAFLKRQRGFDFTAYKPASLTRRIRHRMLMISGGQGEDAKVPGTPAPQIKTFGDYMDYLLVYPAEFNNLFNAILINVTGFFRDARSWETLRREVLPHIIDAPNHNNPHIPHGAPSTADKPAPDAPIRVWSAACSSGEEAYTLAMLFAETMGVEAFLRRVKIYATDINERDLARARTAVYDAHELQGVPEEFFRKYFRLIPNSAPAASAGDADPPPDESKRGSRPRAARQPDAQEPPVDKDDRDEDEETPSFAVPPGSYVFDPELRRRVVFGRHDLLSDAPIPKVHLLTCRNALMYFNSEAQIRVLARLHFALIPGGYLFLGKAEMLLNTSHLFTPIDLKQRVFFKNALPPAEYQVPSSTFSMDAGVSSRLPSPVVGPRNTARPGGLHGEHSLADLAVHSSPVAQIVVGRSGELILANEVASQLFTLTPDNISQRIHDLHVAMSPELREQIDRVFATGQPHVVSDVIWPGGTPAQNRAFDVQLVALMDHEKTPVAVSLTYNETTRMLKLREDLQQATEDRETFHEELQATNEELQSTVEELETTNEELQSTNEELETMNEELQSTNEELRTANDQLRVQGEDAANTASFWNAVMASMRTAVIVLDRDMKVMVWNAHAEDLWGLRGDEAVGKHLLSLDIGLPVMDLKQPVRACLADPNALVTHVATAINRKGRTIQCRISCSPLLGAAKVPTGAIIMMEEVAGESR